MYIEIGGKNATGFILNLYSSIIDMQTFSLYCDTSKRAKSQIQALWAGPVTNPNLCVWRPGNDN